MCIIVSYPYLLIFNTFTDLNVEQLQLLLVVWHNFTKGQRDKILVLCIRALHDISKDAKLSDKVPLYSLRLLLIVDYMLHQSHGPPKELYTQVCVTKCMIWK